jgi:hypothetical protein
MITIFPFTVIVFAGLTDKNAPVLTVTFLQEMFEFTEHVPVLMMVLSKVAGR